MGVPHNQETCKASRRCGGNALGLWLDSSQVSPCLTDQTPEIPNPQGGFCLCVPTSHQNECKADLCTVEACTMFPSTTGFYRALPLCCHQLSQDGHSPRAWQCSTQSSHSPCRRRFSMAHFIGEMLPDRGAVRVLA